MMSAIMIALHPGHCQEAYLLAFSSQRSRDNDFVAIPQYMVATLQYTFVGDQGYGMGWVYTPLESRLK